MSQTPTPVPTPSDLPAGTGALALLCELAMLVLAWVAAWRLGPGGAGSAALAVVSLVAVVAVWARWMAPRSAHRLGGRRRLGAQAALFVAVGVLAAAAGMPGWGVAFVVVAVGVFAVGRDA